MKSFVILVDTPSGGRTEIDLSFTTAESALRSAVQIQRDYDRDCEHADVFVGDEFRVPIAPARWGFDGWPNSRS